MLPPTHREQGRDTYRNRWSGPIGRNVLRQLLIELHNEQDPGEIVQVDEGEGVIHPVLIHTDEALVAESAPPVSDRTHPGPSRLLGNLHSMPRLDVVLLMGVTKDLIVKVHIVLTNIELVEPGEYALGHDSSLISSSRRGSRTYRNRSPGSHRWGEAHRWRA